MTLIGFWCCADSAFIWADTEGYYSPPADQPEKAHLKGRPIDHTLKIAINERACLIVVAAGDAGGNRRIAEAAAYADSFDHFSENLSAYLWPAAKARGEWTGEIAYWTCAAVGWSRRFNRMMGATFETFAQFATHYKSHYAMPRRPEFETLNPITPDDILGFAQQQMHRIRQSLPLAGAGSVTIADLRRTGTNVTSFDLETGRRSPALPKLPAMHEPPSPLPEAFA